MSKSRRKHPKISPLPSVSRLGTFQQNELKEMQAELASRRIEALRLYRPTSQQEEVHQCKASEVLVLGGNRSGKSLCTFVEDARAVTGRDPHGKYPEKDGILVVVGKDWKHIGLVVYPLMFMAGAFKIIKDEQTGEWRAYDPTTDAHRSKDAKPAPPLIPPRMVSKKSWILKSARYIQSCQLVNGWQIYFFSSEGEPPQGFSANRVHIDEDVNNGDSWVPEMQARLSDRKGVLCWSAMPHSRNDALLGLAERADKEVEVGRENPDIVKYQLRFLDNPHIDSEEKRKNIERWSALGVDVLRMRAEGEFISDSILCYPTFSIHVHGYERGDLPNNVVPPDWCRYVAIDPGHAVTAALFAAVPPDESMLLIYDQLYIRQCNAITFGEKMAEKCRGQAFYAFLIDMHGGRLREIGSGRLPVELYTEQLKSREVASQTTGHSFLAGCDDVQARMAAVQNYLHIRPEGTPTLRVLRSSVPDLERELKRYKKKTQLVAGSYIVTDQPNTRGEVHACQCLEYLCAYRPRYHRPKLEVGEEPWYVEWMRKRRKRLSAEADDFIYLGPQSGAQYGSRIL
jgi:hypothetical protein